MPLGKGLGAYFSAPLVEEKKEKNEEVVTKPVASVTVEQETATAEVSYTPSTTPLKKDHLREIPLELISPNPTQPRKNFSELELQDLAQSIQEHGILQPITVKELENGHYEIIAGERRFRASQMAGLASIPALVKPVDAKTQLELALIENIQRQELNPVEEAFAYRRLIDDFKQTQDTVARRVGKSRAHVANMVRLLELPSEVQRGLIEGLITHTKARALLGLSTPAQQVAAYKDMVQDKRITAREAEVLARVSRGGGRRDAVIDGIESKLRETLGTKVYVAYNKGRGNIKIDFYSDEELKEIIKKMGL